MNAPLRRAGLVLGTLAAAWLAAACADSATAPAAAAPSAYATPIEPEDSVCSGYGCEPTGGIGYECFEYDPATQTEYVCTDDPDPREKGLVPSTTIDTTLWIRD
ncbi:MAG TPA: hypothetical protein VHG91_18715 [Longimicrobium sp.]|nr:hypothetical protein [Longimicrobium sp.]